MTSRASRARRQQAHGRLIGAINIAVDEGQSVPCTTGDLWTVEYDDDDDDDHTYAEAAMIRLCHTCGLLDECRGYVTTYPELDGIWGGMTPTEQTKAHREESA